MSAVTTHAALAEPARVTLQGSQAALLHLVLHVPGCRTGVLASVRYSGLGAPGFAARDARRMRAGDVLTLYCAGFGADADGRLRLFGVDHLVHHALDEVPA